MMNESKIEADLPSQSLLQAIVSGGLAATVAAGVALIWNGLFGLSDLFPFLFLTGGFMIGLAALALICLRLFARLPVFWSYGTAIVLGGAAGLSSATLVFRLLGPWALAFSIPVQLCWTLGGASGLLAAAQAVQNPQASFLPGEAIRLLAVSLLTLLLLSLSTIFVSDARTVTLVWGRWSSGPGPLSFNDFTDLVLTSEEKESLSSLGLTGQLIFSGSGTHGRGRKVRLILIMDGPLDKPVDLAIPSEGAVIYVQGQGQWAMYPPEASTIEKTIHLYSPKDKPLTTMYSIAVPGGTSSSGLYDWSELGYPTHDEQNR